MKDKILTLLYRYRTDFSTTEMSMNNYSEYGIREEDFDALANDIDTLITDTKEAEEKQARLNDFYAE
jgi:hypothetical protein